MPQNNCDNHQIAEIIDSGSNFAKENPDIAKAFFNKLGWAFILFFLSAGIASATWGLYFVLKYAVQP